MQVQPRRRECGKSLIWCQNGHFRGRRFRPNFGRLFWWPWLCQGKLQHVCFSFLCVCVCACACDASTMRVLDRQAIDLLNPAAISDHCCIRSLDIAPLQNGVYKSGGRAPRWRSRCAGGRRLCPSQDSSLSVQIPAEIRLRCPSHSLMAMSHDT